MNKFDSIRDFCKNFRIILGITLIGIGIYLNIDTLLQGVFAPSWFYLGIIPLIAGLSGFCPLCIITKKCSIPTKDK